MRPSRHFFQGSSVFSDISDSKFSQELSPEELLASGGGDSPAASSAMSHNFQNASVKSDIWSLAATIAQFLFDQPVWDLYSLAKQFNVGDPAEAVRQVLAASDTSVKRVSQTEINFPPLFESAAGRCAQVRALDHHDAADGEPEAAVPRGLPAILRGGAAGRDPGVAGTPAVCPGSPAREQRAGGAGRELPPPRQAGRQLVKEAEARDESAVQAADRVECETRRWYEIQFHFLIMQ